MTSVRLATPDDIGALVNLTRRFQAENAVSVKEPFDAVRTELTWTYALAEPDDNIIFVTDALDAMMWANLHASPSTDATFASEKIWYADPQSKGAGLAVFRAVQRECKARGATKFSISRNVHGSPRVEQLYRTLGFEPTDVIYAKDL